MKINHLFLCTALLLPSMLEALHNETMLKMAKHFPHITSINLQGTPQVASNGQSSFISSGMLFPENERDLIKIIKYFSWLKEKDMNLRPMTIMAGSRPLGNKLSSGWSFDSHAHGHDGDIVLNTSKLTGLYEDIDWLHNFDRQKGVLKVWVYAGTPWREMVDLVNESYERYSKDQNHYFVPIIAPTGSKITLGGSFASNTHARGSSVNGGYFADTVDAFNVATIVKGQAMILRVDKKEDPTLFYSLIGSFGRGGVVSAIKINLQMVAKNQVVSTKAKKVANINEVIKAFSADRSRLRASASGPRSDRDAFLATVALISNDFDTFYMLENDLVSPADKKPSFPLFGAPDCKTSLIHKAARALPKLADCLASKFLDWHCSETPCEFFSGQVSGLGEFHDEPLNNYIFFQDSFALGLLENKPKDYQTSHLTLMMKLENLGLAMEQIKTIKNQPKYSSITFELQDLLPLPSTKVLMAPAYQEQASDDIFVAYTLSWPVNYLNRDLSIQLQRQIEKTLFEYKHEGQPLAWLHPLKEFSFKEGPIEFYQNAAEKLEKTLFNYGIEADSLFYNRTHDYLYSR